MIIAVTGASSSKDLLKQNNRNFLIFLPTFFLKLIHRIYFLRKVLEKLFSILVLDNSKLKSEMGVTLLSTKDALSSTNS
tara:strand:- start:286 stop:522 length:237 start_codon:yes stop_codon:yes gene_type:complete